MIRAFSQTDIGRKRKINQDFVYTTNEPLGNLPNVFVVADGMGGHNAGDYASKVTVETIVAQVSASFEKNPVKILGKAIETANRLIYQKAHEDADLEGMGTTVVAATCMGKYMHVVNVGDSRLYIVNDKEIKQITRDHSLVEEMVRMGGLPRAEARNHPDKNIITRAVGVSETVEPEFFAVELSEKDKVLICSDGLTNMLEDEEIRVILNKTGDIEDKAQELIRVANENGGKDNITVVIIEPFA